MVLCPKQFLPTPQKEKLLPARKTLANRGRVRRRFEAIDSGFDAGGMP